MTNPKSKPARRTKPSATESSLQKPRARRQAAAPETQTDGTATAPAAPEPATSAAKGPGGKLGVIVGLMRRPEGATVAQMGEAAGWQPHSVRGALAGALKRKHQLTIVSEPGEHGRIYRIAPEQSV